MRGYGQFCPIARTLDLLGDKWTLLIVRELLRGKRRFRDIEAGLPGIPPNLLSDRLKVLEQAAIVTREYFRELPPRVEYSLTDRGASLQLVLESIAEWGMQHMMEGEVPCDRVELDLLFFHLPRFLCPEKAADIRGTVEVRLEGEGGGSWWVRFDGGECSVCRDSAEPANAVIACPIDTWVEVMALHRAPERLASTRGVRFEGDVSLARRFGTLFCRDSPSPTLAVPVGPGEGTLASPSTPPR
ncbi:MAG TPA: winged helix-turn-helix transcriptional regulator [Chloroflexota bacterium]|nr:winged helix-turn-helix transcriptional regulator [Chloroflexota bacterium]